MNNDSVQVLVVGGGIVGAGVARDAAMRGLKTTLVEQNDFASGTSSRSSRLLHGGIRYLAQGRIGLVWEASREKSLLFEIAPHLAETLPFIFPTRKRTPWALWKLSIGVRLYDLLCGIGKVGRSHNLSRRKLLEKVPQLSDTNLTGAVRYFDALTNDARLVIDTLRSATTHGAEVYNYTKLLDAQRDGDSWNCLIQPAGRSDALRLRAQTVVNATGPWSSRIPNSKTDLRLTKGVHLVIDRSRLPVPDAVVVTEGDRVLFAIPWGERVILGTTDTDYDGPLDDPRCDGEDIRYVLSIMNDAFPTANLTPADIISTWAGIRPLVADKRGNPSDISRRHEVKMGHPGWFDVTGGKLTTYRLMAEETVNAIEKYTNGSRHRSLTASRALLENGQDSHGLGILPPEVSEDVVQHICRAEWAQHLDDIMVRRTSWHYYHRNHDEIAEKVAAWMKDELSWTDAQHEAELQRYRSLTDHGTTPAPHFHQRDGHGKTMRLATTHEDRQTRATES